MSFNKESNPIPQGFPGSLKRRRQLSKISRDAYGNNCRCCGLPYTGYYSVDPKSLLYYTIGDENSTPYNQLSAFGVCRICWDDNEVSMDDIRKYYIEQIRRNHSQSKYYSPTLKISEYTNSLEKSLIKAISKSKLRESKLNKLC